jgi:hypothetical protein
MAASLWAYGLADADALGIDTPRFIEHVPDGPVELAVDDRDRLALGGAR